MRHYAGFHDGKDATTHAAELFGAESALVTSTVHLVEDVDHAAVSERCEAWKADVAAGKMAPVSAVFGIGGIRPFAPSVGGGQRVVAPVPWLPDAPRGSAVWRSSAGVTSAVRACNHASCIMPGKHDLDPNACCASAAPIPLCPLLRTTTRYFSS